MPDDVSDSNFVDLPKIKDIKVSFSKIWTENRTQPGDIGATVTEISYWDWTYCTDYCCSLSTLSPTNFESDQNDMTVNKRSIICARALAIATHPNNSAAQLVPTQNEDQTFRWERCSPGGIDVSLLERETDPILFYDDLMLYQVRFVQVELASLI